MSQQPPEDELEQLYDPLDDPESFEPKPIYTYTNEDFEDEDHA